VSCFARSTQVTLLLLLAASLALLQPLLLSVFLLRLKTLQPLCFLFLILKLRCNCIVTLARRTSCRGLRNCCTGCLRWWRVGAQVMQW
jgi:hypothetical protein